jgi:hypothetical protein
MWYYFVVISNLRKKIQSRETSSYAFTDPILISNNEISYILDGLLLKLC